MVRLMTEASKKHRRYRVDPSLIELPGPSVILLSGEDPESRRHPRRKHMEGY